MLKYAFAAIVKLPAGSGKWTVEPQIMEPDGTMHPNIDVIVSGGITPGIGDTVLVEVMMNNKDLAVVHRFFEPTESNGVIIGILKTAGQYVLTGSYVILGNLTVANLTVLGIMNTVNLNITGALTFNGVPFSPVHTHLPGTYSNSGGPVTGVSGPPV
jgi:hypothetical protein